MFITKILKREKVYKCTVYVGVTIISRLIPRASVSMVELQGASKVGTKSIFFNYYAPSQPNRLKFYTRIPKTLGDVHLKIYFQNFMFKLHNCSICPPPIFWEIFFGIF